MALTGSVCMRSAALTDEEREKKLKRAERFSLETPETVRKPTITRTISCC